MDEGLFDGLKRMVIRAGHKWTDEPSADILVDMKLLKMEAIGYKGSQLEAESIVARLEMQLSFVAVHVSIISCVHKIGSDLNLARSIKDSFHSD